MDAAEYQRILNAGTGRAVRMLARRADIPRETLLAACLHYTAFDPATEGDRSRYLFRVLQATGDLPVYRDAILSSLTETGAHRYDLAQRFALAACFARRGDAVARQAIYDAFLANAFHLWNPRDGSVVGAVEIVALDGWQGFLVVAGCLGALGKTHEHIWFTDGLLIQLERQSGAQESATALIPVMQAQKNIAAFIAEAQAHRHVVATARAITQTDTPLSYAQLRTFIMQSDGRTLRRSLARWGADATVDDLTVAARDLASVTDLGHARAYASLFAQRPFPADPAPLIALAQSEDTTAAQAALVALAHVAHPAVRALALELLDDPVRRVMAVDLLAPNYLPGDENRILALLNEDVSPHTWHWLGYGALAVFAAHPDANASVLHCIYEHTPCSHCRYRAVALLQDRGQLSDAMVDECRHDAHAGTRALAAQAAQATTMMADAEMTVMV